MSKIRFTGLVKRHHNLTAGSEYSTGFSEIQAKKDDLWCEKWLISSNHALIVVARRTSAYQRPISTSVSASK